MSTIQESLKKLMTENRWTAEHVTKAIKSLQSVSVEKGNLIPYCLLGEKKQKILECSQEHGAIELLYDIPFEWDACNTRKSLFGTEIYRINPSFAIPDLSEETPPRYASGTLLGFSDGTSVEVVDRELWGEEPPTVSAGNWCAIRFKDGSVGWIGRDGDGIRGWLRDIQQLPPRHTLQEGWEYTGKAACIDGTQQLAEGEIYIPLHWSGIHPSGHEPIFNKWRHLARKKKPVYDGQSNCTKCGARHPVGQMVNGICAECIGKKEKEPEPTYVDYTVNKESPNNFLCYRMDGKTHGIGWAQSIFRFIAYIYADGTESMDCRRPLKDGGSAEWPTHVRMQKEIEMPED